MLIVCVLSAKQGTLYLFIFIFKAILANPYYKVSLVSNTGAKVSGFFGLREDTNNIGNNCFLFSSRDDKLKLWHNSCCNFRIVNIIVLRGSVSHVKGCQGSF